MNPAQPLVEVRNLTKYFKVGHFGTTTLVRAVEDVSFTIGRGETYALVGESGCGKTTLMRLILGLEQPTSGSIRFGGEDVTGARGAVLARFRRQAQAVFQDPFSSLNPRLRVGTIITEPLVAQRWGDRRKIAARLGQLLETVGLPASAADLFPHEFSGGQRQRIAIARALALQPPFMVLDEPISALDVSIRAQILNLLADLQAEFGLTYLVVAHDLALVEQFATRVGVMYLGSLLEQGPVEQVFGDRRHPYTAGLLDSVPRPDPAIQVNSSSIRGDVGSPVRPPPGCRFHPRCPHAMDVCRSEPPQARNLSPVHWAACHLVPENTAATASTPPVPA